MENNADNPELEDLTKTLAGLTAFAESSIKSANEQIEKAKGLMGMETDQKKIATISRQRCIVSMLKNGTVLIDFTDAEKARTYFENLK